MCRTLRAQLPALALATLTVLIAACTLDAPRERYPVAGRAVAGPVCPVEEDPPDPACAPRPVSGAVILVLDGSEREVARVETDRDGAFSLTLPAGAYTLVPQPHEGLLGTPAPVLIDVADDDPSLLDLLELGYDTGIR